MKPLPHYEEKIMRVRIHTYQVQRVAYEVEVFIEQVRNTAK